VRFGQEIAGIMELGMAGRGEHSEILSFVGRTVDSEISGNVIDLCPVGALTDRTFRFASRVWFTKPMDAHRDCDKCSGKVVVWYKGEEILRVTGRKDQWGELESFICNTCRFERKDTKHWLVEGPRKIDRHSVIGAGHYERKVQQKLLHEPAPDAPKVEPFDFTKR
jgi:NADH-quinone oxidoreductase subunit G